MSLFLQLTINGLIAGSIYALVASGFSLIYKTNRFMHFAHGISITVAGYILFQLFSLWNIPFYLSAILTILLAGLFGVFMYEVVYVPLQKRKASNVILLIASIGLLTLFQNVVQLRWGASVRTIGYIEVSRGMDFFGASITPLQVVIIVTSAIVLLGLWIFMKYTKLGRNIRAVSDNPELSEIVGISVKKVARYSFFIGSAIAGIGGVLIGLEQNLVPTMGTTLIVKGFTGAVIGGITSVPGSVFGSYLLGLVENYGIWYLPSGYKDAIAFVLLFVFLLIKPTGLFGVDKGVKG